MSLREEALHMHRVHKGKLESKSKIPVKNAYDLSLAYSPGVAEPCKDIYDDKNKVYDYTMKGNMVAVVSDGNAVLGLGNIGPEAALPVMEGKAVLFKSFAGVDAFPICLNTTDIDQIVNTVKLLEPTFGGVNLEDIAAPNCFVIEERLKKETNIPFLHDDQHGTAIVTVAGLVNALKLVGNGSLADVIKGADVFIGVSVQGALTKEMVQAMNENPIIFAMANPVPEIMPDDAKDAGAKVIGTGRSDFPNQVNNVLAFPGIFRGALDVRATNINEQMKIAAVEAIAALISEGELSSEYVIPGPFDPRVAPAVASAVAKAAMETGVARIKVDPEEVAEKTRQLAIIE